MCGGQAAWEPALHTDRAFHAPPSSQEVLLLRSLQQLSSQLQYTQKVLEPCAMDTNSLA